MSPKHRKQKDEALAKCRQVMRLQHKAWTTEESYISAIGSYISWLINHGQKWPDSRSRMEAYLTQQAQRGISASTQNVIFNALLFFYQKVRGEKLAEIQALRAHRPHRARTSLPKDVTMKLLEGVPDVNAYPTQFIGYLLYGLGLRVTEPLNLRVKDVDVSGSRITIRDGKGGKDRTLRVPCSLMAGIQEQLKRARRVWEADQQTGLPVQLPDRLDRKNKKAAFAWQWAFVFPAHRPCPHPRTGEIVRYRMHECNVQRAFQVSAKAMGLDGVATPHVMRHCYATHVLDAGANIRDVQEHLGHAHVDTTAIYAHGDGERVRSPLEVLP